MIPEELNREMFVTVENDSIEIWETPSTLTGTILAGVPPEPADATMYFVDYDSTADKLIVRTKGGLEFNIYNSFRPDEEPE